MFQDCYEALCDGRVRPRIVWIPALLVLRALLYRGDDGGTTAPSGARLTSPAGTPRGRDRLVYIFLATLARWRGSALLEFSPRAIPKMFGLRWTAKVATAALLRVLESRFHMPRHARGCKCVCTDLCKGLRVVDDHQYCKETKTYRIQLSADFMNEVRRGVPARTVDLMHLAPSPAVMDVFMWMLIRAYRGNRAAVQLAGDGGLLEQFRASDHVPKAKQSVIERFARILAEVWHDAPYRFHKKKSVAKCEPDVDPQVALARLLRVKDLSEFEKWDELSESERWALGRSESERWELPKSSGSESERPESPGSSESESKSEPSESESERPELPESGRWPELPESKRRQAERGAVTPSWMPRQSRAGQEMEIYVGLGDRRRKIGATWAEAEATIRAEHAALMKGAAGAVVNAPSPASAESTVEVAGSDCGDSGVSDPPGGATSAMASAPAISGDAAEHAVPAQLPEPPPRDVSALDPFTAALYEGLGLKPGSSPNMEKAVVRTIADQVSQKLLVGLALQLCSPVQPQAVADRPEARPPGAVTAETGPEASPPGAVIAETGPEARPPGAVTAETTSAPAHTTSTDTPSTDTGPSADMPDRESDSS